ncbi:MAG: MFS transporter [Verrucomicrobia bacterium]|jgi:MFS family permease|nr:MAG: MFS transporter [Verrucomicrobiota bacterium]
MSTNTRDETRALWLVGALHAFTHIYHVALLPLYLLMQRDFGFASVGHATALVTAMMIAYFLPSYFQGMLADRVSRKKLLAWGLLINSLGFTALAFSPNYPCALAAVIVAGIGGSCYHPAATAMIARMYPNNTGRALGLVGMGASVGFFIGPIYSGWRAGALEATLGAAAWRKPVMEFGLLGIIASILFAWFAVEEKLTDVKQKSGAPAQKMFPTRALWFVFIASAFAFCFRDFAGTSMGSLGSLFLQQAHGYNTALTGVVISCIFLPSVISNPLFGHLSDGGRKRWTASVMLIATALIALFPHVPKSWAIPTLLLYGFFFMASYPMVEAMLMESVPDAVRGRVFGLFITIGGLLGNLSHWIAGDAVKRLGKSSQTIEGYFPLYYGLAAFVVISLLGLLGLGTLRKRARLEAAK